MNYNQLKTSKSRKTCRIRSSSRLSSYGITEDVMFRTIVNQKLREDEEGDDHDDEQLDQAVKRALNTYVANLTSFVAQQKKKACWKFKEKL